MTRNAAQILARNSSEATVEDSYSGRGMFGATTYGIIFENERDFLTTLSSMMLEEDRDDIEIVAEELPNLKTDDMGLNIIYY